LVILILCFARAGFGGAFWLVLIGGMLLGVHRVLLRMASVRIIRFSSITVAYRKENILKNNFFPRIPILDFFASNMNQW
jgi:hypothetical protein